VALDPLRSISVIPAPSKAGKTAAGTPSAAASLNPGYGLGSSHGASGSTGSGFNSGAGLNSGAGSNSGVGSGPGTRAGDSSQRTDASSGTHSAQGTGSTSGRGPGSSTSGGNHGASGSDGSNRSGASHSSSGSSAKASGKDSGSRTASSNAKPGSNARARQGASQSKPATTNATAGAANAAAGSAANAKGGANPQDNTPPATFLEALAQSQADAAQNAAAAASPIAAPTAAPADTGDVTAPIGGKAKTSHDKDSDAAVGSSLAFISQSLAAAIAGVQQPTPAQAIAPTGSAAGDSDTDSDATEAISMAGGSSAAVQTLVTTLANDTADGLKTAADAGSATSGPKSDPPASTAPAADGGSAAVSAFQAQMSISSHFQQPAAADSSPNRINAPVGSAAFNDELGGKITWLANQGIQSASVELSPEHLGPVSVHISVQAGSASVSFNAAHADTRAALEQALPRLREMFATNGLTLSDANVSHQSPRGQAQKQSITAIGGVSGGTSDEATPSTVTSVASSRLGLVDTYV
jgi:flagellar hook-length control protein FliK